METSFPVNIKANVLRQAVKPSIVGKFFHSEQFYLTSSIGIPIGTGDLSYHRRTVQTWVKEYGLEQHFSAIHFEFV